MAEEPPKKEIVQKKKVRQCMFVLYPESQQAIIDYVQKTFACAWALHDKDVYEEDAKDGSYKKGDLMKPHIHFVCTFSNPRYLSGIAKELDVPENTINYCHNLYKAFVYLWHGNDSDKYQYDPSIVGRHDFVTPTEGPGAGMDEQAQVEAMLEMPFGEMSTTVEMARWAYENGCWSTFRSSYAIWRDIRSEIRASRTQQQTCYGTNVLHPDNPTGYQPVAMPGMSFEEAVKYRKS